MIDARRKAYLDAMGIRVWVRRQLPPEPESPPMPVQPAPTESRIQAPDANPNPFSGPSCVNGAPVEPVTLSELDWDGLAESVAACRRCPELFSNRTQTVFGVGSHKAELMVIGDAPSADEDHEGRPFVGGAGRLLDNMLRAVGFHLSTVYITNILKCRPPDDRDPEPDETAACAGFLHRQIELVRPKAILVVGRAAARNLLGTDQLAGFRGDVHQYASTSIPVIVTDDPAYLLSSPAEKREVWNDLRLVRRVQADAIA